MKINLKIKRNIKEATVREMPIYSGNTITSFKRFLITSENGAYNDAILDVSVNDADASEIKKLGYAIIEKSYNNVVIYRVKLGVFDVIDGHIFLRYPFENRRFSIESVNDYITEAGKHYYKLLLGGKHGVAVGDKDCCGYSSLSLFDIEGNDLSEVTDWFVDEETDKLYINVPSIIEPENGWYVTFNFDPLVYNDIKDEEGDELYPGDWHFYDDLNASVTTKIIYENPNIAIPIGLSSDTDYVGLRQNELVDDYYKKLTKDIVPDFINTEKTKYIPYIYSGSIKNSEGFDVDELNGPANRIEFYLHFRSREKEVVFDDGAKTVYGGMPTESWSVETEETIASGSDVKSPTKRLSLSSFIS